MPDDCFWSGLHIFQPLPPPAQWNTFTHAGWFRAMLGCAGRCLNAGISFSLYGIFLVCPLHSYKYCMLHPFWPFWTTLCRFEASWAYWGITSQWWSACQFRCWFPTLCVWGSSLHCLSCLDQMTHSTRRFDDTVVIQPKEHICSLWKRHYGANHYNNKTTRVAFQFYEKKPSFKRCPPTREGGSLDIGGGRSVDKNDRTQKWWKNQSSNQSFPPSLMPHVLLTGVSNF